MRLSRGVRSMARGPRNMLAAIPRRMAMQPQNPKPLATSKSTNNQHQVTWAGPKLIKNYGQDLHDSEQHYVTMYFIKLRAPQLTWC